MYQGNSKVDVICEYCRGTFSLYPSQMKGRKRFYCSPECRELYKEHTAEKPIPVICETCGIEFQILPSKVAGRVKFFCSKQCQLMLLRVKNSRRAKFNRDLGRLFSLLDAINGEKDLRAGKLKISKEGKQLYRQLQKAQESRGSI